MDGQQAAATLGVGPGETRDEIRQAFRARAKLVHPDTGPTGSMDQFIVLRRAFDLLMVNAPDSEPVPSHKPVSLRRPAPFHRPGLFGDGGRNSERPPATIDLSDVRRRNIAISPTRPASRPALPKRDSRGLSFAEHLSTALARS